jgi:hypothetical protein
LDNAFSAVIDELEMYSTLRVHETNSFKEGMTLVLNGINQQYNEEEEERVRVNYID